MKKTSVILDIELYRNYLLVMFFNEDKKGYKYFEAFHEGSLEDDDKYAKLSTSDIDKIHSILNTFEIVTFNGNGYDLPILNLALKGFTTAELKVVSDRIIDEGLKPWHIERQYQVKFRPVDHIDLIEVAPGKASLKLYGGRLHCSVLQDLPIEPGAIITQEDRINIVTYCKNDHTTTQTLFNKLKEQIDLRRKMSAEYGIDLRSKSDAQIAEAVIKSEIEKLIGTKLKKSVSSSKQAFTYEVPSYIKFSSEPLKEILNTLINATFIAEDNGSLSMSCGDLLVTIGDTTYKIGMGGLHSQEEERCYVSDEDHILIDRDVASYYPRIILNLKLFPENLGERFLNVYESIVDRRLEAKRIGDKVTADSLKICVNGSFGKLGSIYSILYAPNLLIQTTITGQLSLMMLIERLEKYGIKVVSANTDGIVVNCERKLLKHFEAIMTSWENHTSFETEETRYAALYSRDVNNYIAIKEDGKVKTKGTFSSAALSKNPQTEICSLALIEYLKNGTPFEETIRACKDITKFVIVRTVKGGAVKGVNKTPLPEYSDKEELVRLAGFYATENKNRYQRLGFEGEEKEVTLGVAFKLAQKILTPYERYDYLGKAIRWYYSIYETETIDYKSNGNSVPMSAGGRPIMRLPEEFPDDIDYDKYVNICEEMLMDIGVVKRPLKIVKTRKKKEAVDES